MRTRNNESKRKHLTSMKTMLGVYETMLREKGDLLSLGQRCHLQKRVDWSVQNILFDSLLILSKDEQQDLYRYVAKKQKSLNWGKLSIHYGLKNFMVNLIGLPLKYRLYYALIGRVLDLVKKR